MKRDIPIKKVKGFGVAIVPREGNIDDEFWDVYIINFKDDPISSVLINSRGYGKLEGDNRETTTFRHFYDELAGQSAQMVETIHEDVFNLTNEFWVSFSYAGYLYDKKYVFVRGVIDEDFLIQIPIVGLKGIMIK